MNKVSFLPFLYIFLASISTYFKVVVVRLVGRTLVSQDQDPTIIFLKSK